MLWRIRWEDLQFESPNKYHKRAGSRLTLSQVNLNRWATIRNVEMFCLIQSLEVFIHVGLIITAVKLGPPGICSDNWICLKFRVPLVYVKMELVDVVVVFLEMNKLQP